MLSAFTNCLKIPELRNRIFFTAALIFVARVGANIPLPGINSAPLQDFMNDQTGAGGSLLGFYNMFTGGALLKGAVFALGIMPYISASIIMQLAGAVVPWIARLQQEGDVGRQKISQYTRYLTIIICVIQSVLLLLALSNNPGSLIGQGQDFIQKYGKIIIEDNHVWFLIRSTIFLTTGTVILMWLGEQITQRGIGNGISLLITIGIISDLPRACVVFYKHFFGQNTFSDLSVWPQVIGMFFLLLIVTMGIVAMTQALRKIPIQYAKRVVNRKVYSGQSSFLPLKINYAGVMPVIFASAILMFPQQIFQQLYSWKQYDIFQSMANFLQRGGWFYYLTYGGLILVFSYFWVSIMFKPVQIADDLKKNGGYIPGIRPGQNTANYLDHVMTRLTFAGSLFLTIVAVFPDLILGLAKIPYVVATFFGGTGMLITVGVMLDTMRQVETHLLQRHYDGFLKKGKLRGRSTSRVQQSLDTDAFKDTVTHWKPLLIVAVALFAFGIIAFFLNMGK
ncbi:MAG: preprotein translocase subunit SecY [Opitutae bacterium]|nr:preprotein translocase subunit SecY [Opitutae bacterium]MBT4224300.1 preprotein translocase subunit SecY [Opitutae bacterium]MBT5377821.1 preprotein translocase subunit SecY [Opitutae bacterium]MBT5692201.1 preprotein translocase subunit SecY [Opitutae bacterium]MBT6463658.1 preprotein translocase subunit SecY [Opitutae bacterium]